MSILVPIFVGIVAGFATKSIINWLSIDGFNLKIIIILLSLHLSLVRSGHLPI